MTKQTDVDEVFAVYKQWHPRAVLDKKRRRLIEQRLGDGFSVKDLADAINGCHHSPFHMGENDRGRKYNDLGLILRDADHVERFIDVPVPGASGGGTVVSSIRMLEARKRREQQAS